MLDEAVVGLQPHQHKDGGHQCVWKHPAPCWPLVRHQSNLHAVREIWPQSAGWTKDSGKEEDDGDPATADTLHQGTCAKGTLNPLVDLGAAGDDSRLHYVDGTGFGSTLFDARNGFNKLNQYLMLWNVAHL